MVDARRSTDTVRSALTLFPKVTWVVVPVAAVMFVGGVIGIAVADSQKWLDVWLELAKAGIGVIAIAFLGGGIAAAFKRAEEQRRRDDQRDEEARAAHRRRDHFRAELVGELLDAYHEIKSVRRVLKAAGFTGAESNDQRKQSKVYIEQMPRIDAAQLTLERILRTIRREQELFEPYHLRLLHLLRLTEDYAQKLLDDWEAKEPKRQLAAFIGSSRKQGGIRRLSVAVERASNLIYALRSQESRVSDDRVQFDTDPEVDGDLYAADLDDLPEMLARKAEKPESRRKWEEAQRN